MSSAHAFQIYPSWSSCCCKPLVILLQPPLHEPEISKTDIHPCMLTSSFINSSWLSSLIDLEMSFSFFFVVVRINNISSLNCRLYLFSWKPISVDFVLSSLIFIGYQTKCCGRVWECSTDCSLGTAAWKDGCYKCRIRKWPRFVSIYFVCIVFGDAERQNI